MKRHYAATVLVLLMSLTALSQNAVMRYTIDVTKNPDTFYVQLELTKKPKAGNDIFQFASTAPGTYQTMNIGRFVSGFKAFDKKGNLIPVEKVSVNQYRISKPKKLKRVEYQVAETFDTPVDSFEVYPMCGSTIKPEYALINTHTMLGYIKGWQRVPFAVEVIRPRAWITGSALSSGPVDIESRNDSYRAATYDDLIDGPILTGKLSVAGTTIAGAAVGIYTYSDSAKIVSDSLLHHMTGMLSATGKFLGKLPVDRYTFLYLFMQKPPAITGAWEHSYSSEYVLGLNPVINGMFYDRVTDIASHEFFHIVTPLNIHSEIIESFNFVQPVPSLHLWLYEGVTEWASHILQMRAGLIPVDAGNNNYMANAVTQKIMLDAMGRFDSTWSLKKLAEESFTAAGSQNYGDIYFKGSLTATYLDIRLLELSGGKRGLRELLLELMAKYGKSKPISEAHFIDDLVAMTYPEIRDFFNRYVLSNEPLPHAEYLAKIGFQYTREKGNNGRPVIKVQRMPQPSAQQQQLFDAWRVNLPLQQ